MIDRLAEVAGHFGYRWCGINGLPPSDEGADPIMLAERPPDGFREFYIWERLYLLDHNCARARVSVEPFSYAEAADADKDRRGRQRFIDAIADFDVTGGLVVPIGRPSNLPACVWLSGRDPDGRPAVRRMLTVISLFAASKVRALCAAATPSKTGVLSPRERELLRWIAVGKTSWEISTILGMSESAANRAIGVAMAKLDAVTRAQAVVNAIRSGEIEF